MKELGFKDLKLRKLTLPHDTPRRIKSDSAIAIADTAWNDRLPIGIINPPTVRRIETPIPGKDPRVELVVVAGGDRVAAAIHANVDHLWCKIVECTDAEAEAIQIVENTHRRDDATKRAERLERLKNVMAGKHARDVQEGKEKPGATRTKVKVRQEVAKAVGIKPESVRKAEQRARKRVQEAVVESAPVVEPEEAEECIETFGVELLRPWLVQIKTLQELLERASRYLTSTKGVLTQIQTQELPFPPARLQAMQAAASELSELVSSLVPRSLCPYCKGQDGLQQKCAACVDLGYISEGQMNYPVELKDPNTVLVGGKFQSIDADETIVEELQSKMADALRSFGSVVTEERLEDIPIEDDPFEGLGVEK